MDLHNALEVATILSLSRQWRSHSDHNLKIFVSWWIRSTHRVALLCRLELLVPICISSLAVEVLQGSPHIIIIVVSMVSIGIVVSICCLELSISLACSILHHLLHVLLMWLLLLLWVLVCKVRCKWLLVGSIVILSVITHRSLALSHGWGWRWLRMVVSGRSISCIYVARGMLLTILECFSQELIVWHRTVHHVRVTIKSCS